MKGAIRTAAAEAVTASACFVPAVGAVVVWRVLDTDPGPALGLGLVLAAFAALAFLIALARHRWPRTTTAGAAAVSLGLLASALAVEGVSTPAPDPQPPAWHLARFAQSFPDVHTSWVSSPEPVVVVTVGEDTPRLSVHCTGINICAFGSSLGLDGWRVRVVDNRRLEPIYECAVTSK